MKISISILSVVFQNLSNNSEISRSLLCLPSPYPSYNPNTDSESLGFFAIFFDNTDTKNVSESFFRYILLTWATVFSRYLLWFDLKTTGPFKASDLLVPLKINEVSDQIIDVWLIYMCGLVVKTYRGYWFEIFWNGPYFIVLNN